MRGKQFLDGFFWIQNYKSSVMDCKHWLVSEADVFLKTCSEYFKEILRKISCENIPSQKRLGLFFEIFLKYLQ